ncbi:hypothetical protein [Agathobaculum sp.]|uniref:hypothetical protein n=1 Tax=Agathobaculum sp. TaxID=2048138 RepID=UPI0025E058B4|nr:hypothetical protein [Agathobaculum sp.]MBS6641458.1 hypothetical protein [Clostridiaceae bacterium]
MVKLIIGGTGSGKTKEIVDQVNAAVKEEKGSVVCISRGNKLTFDISHDARLIDATDYPIKDYASLLGFVCGIHAGNYDITRVFIDSLYKIAGIKDVDQAEAFLNDLEKFSEKHSVNFTVAMSEDQSAITEGMKRFL